MTLPLGTGFPDFARQASEAQVLEINDINVTHGDGFNYASRYVGNARALQLWANAVASGLRLQFQFWGDNPNTILMDSYVVNLRGNDVAKQPIPIMGPFLTVFVQTETAGNQTYTLQLWRTPELARFAGLEGDIAIFSQNGTAIGAGATATIDHQYVMEGPAHWSGLVTNTPWDIELIAVDYRNNETILDQASSQDGPLHPRSVYLPPWHIRAKIFNGSGVLSLYDLYVTRRHNA